MQQDLVQQDTCIFSQWLTYLQRFGLKKQVCVKSILPKFCFFGHDFWTRNARKPIIGLKDLDYRLVSNIKLIKKLSLAVRKPTLLMTSPAKKSKTFQLFSMQTTTLAASFVGLNSFLTLLPGKLWSYKVAQKYELNMDFQSTVAIGYPERHVRKASHCGSKQQ